MATSWFLRTGTNPLDPNSYTKQASIPTCPSGANKICGIFDTVDPGDVPELGDLIKDEMILALDSRTSSTNVKLKA